MIQQRDIDYAIIRFGSFYSEDSEQTIKLLEGIKKRKIPIVGKGDYLWNMIHVDDAAASILYVLMNKDKLKNRILNVSDFNPISFKDMLNEMASAMQCNPPVHIPQCLGRLILGKAVYGVLTSSYKLSKAQSLQDWYPKYPNFREGIQSVINEIAGNESQAK